MVFGFPLDTETVGQLPLSPPWCVEPEMSVRALLEELKRESRGSALVCRQGKLVGIFTERDALRLMAAGADLDGTIEQVMTKQPATISRSESVQAAIAKMSWGGYRRLPVVDAEGRPLGLLKATGILHFLVQHFPKFIYNLPPTPKSTTRDREGA